MTLATITRIRQKLAPLLKSVEGVNASFEYPPETHEIEQTAWVGFDVEDVTSGQRELGVHRIEIFYVVSRNVQLGRELRATEDVIQGVKEVIRKNQSLDMPSTVDRVQVMQVRQALVKLGEVELTGFVMTINVKTHESVSYT